jgi:hypothetical protein
MGGQPDIIPIEAGAVLSPTFRQRVIDLFFLRDRLVLRLRLGRRRGHELAVGLVRLSNELNCFRRHATNHNPESKIYFQREWHRVSPLFDFRGLEATNAAQGTKVPTGDLG